MKGSVIPFTDLISAAPAEHKASDVNSAKKFKIAWDLMTVIGKVAD